VSGPPPNKISRAADWFELQLLSSADSRLGKSTIEKVLAARAPELSDDQLGDLTADLLAEVERRHDLSGDLYPFERRVTGVFKRDVTDDVQLLYIFLALASTYPTFRQTAVGFRPGRIFEHLTARALRVWSGGEALVFADAPPGESTGIRAAITRLGVTLSVTSYPSKARKARKDHGLDVVAFRPFHDRRAAHPVLLCQCTLAWTLVAKAREVAVGEWGTMLDMREGTFSAALAVPHALPPDYEHWDEVRRNTDLIVERTRLLRLLSSDPDPAADVRPSSDKVLAHLTAWRALQATS
jgi:hypothetical protein